MVVSPFFVSSFVCVVITRFEYTSSVENLFHFRCVKVEVRYFLLCEK